MSPKILVVDDEPDILLPILRGLKLRRIEVDGFTNPLDALAIFSAGKYSLAILDIALPELSGFQLARKLLSRDPKIKVSFLSSWPHFEISFKSEFPNLSQERFLLKPISVDELVRFVRLTLENSGKKYQLSDIKRFV